MSEFLIFKENKMFIIPDEHETPQKIFFIQKIFNREQKRLKNCYCRESWTSQTNDLFSAKCLLF